MFSKTKIALSAAIVLSTAFSASAATTHHPAHVHRSAIYKYGPWLQFANLLQFKRSAIHGRWEPRYNQMLLID